MRAPIAIRYRHTQTGYRLLLPFAAATVVLTVLALREGERGAAVLLAAILLVILAFCRLTIEISGGELRARYAGGWTVKRIGIHEIASVEVVQNPWYYGWGIRITPHGMLYNVSGTRGVEIRPRSGPRFRLGSDEPEALRAAIVDSLSSPPPARSTATPRTGRT